MLINQNCLLLWSKASANVTISEVPQSFFNLLVRCPLLQYKLLVLYISDLMHQSPEECKGFQLPALGLSTLISIQLSTQNLSLPNLPLSKPIPLPSYLIAVTLVTRTPFHFQVHLKSTKQIKTTTMCSYSLIQQFHFQNHILRN